MPFIPHDQRFELDRRLAAGEFPVADTVGQQCFLFYRDMVARWNMNPRWQTAHEIYRDMVNPDGLCLKNEDQAIAHKLAWQVFFQTHVMPYEEEKRKLNGDVT